MPDNWTRRSALTRTIRELGNLERAELDELIEKLTDPARRVSSRGFPGPLADLESPGLYAWWIDGNGASDLSNGLGHSIAEGLVYAGQAGAGMSSRSLAQRLRQHRRGNIRGSTFRRTLAAALCEALAIEPLSPGKIGSEAESRLCDWIDEHMSVAVFPIADRGRLLVAEALVLARLEPPLNLDGMVSTPLREHLSLRRGVLNSATLVKRTGETTVGIQAATIAMEGAIPVSGRIDAVALLAGLLGKTIPTLTGKPNRILALDEQKVTVATGKSPTGEEVPIVWIQTALDRLVRERSLDINVENVGYRSAFIGAVLVIVPGTKSQVSPRRVYFP